ncbi:MAG: hypothetical protein PHI11_13020 [Gallionella sp.]|nr:hypothetical protein [Gallionella sp.]
MSTLDDANDLSFLPVLNDPVVLDDSEDLPVLTDIIHVPDIVATTLVEHQVVPESIAPTVSLSEEAYQQLVERLEDHLENLLNQKITTYLERLKLQLIEQVVEEVKLELSHLTPESPPVP